MNKIYEDLINTKEFQEQLKQLPEKEKETLLKSIKEIINNFDNLILKPFEKLKNK